MTKDEVLTGLRQLAASHELTKDEVVAVFEAATPVDALSKKLGIADMLYYLGGGIVFLGIAIFVEQNWSTLSSATKLLATLGSGVVAYAMAALLGRSERLDGISAAFYLISGLTFPVGLYILLDNAGINIETGWLCVIAGALLALYLGSFVLMRKTVLALFSILFGTGFVILFTNYLMSGNPTFESFVQYQTFFVGLSYLLLGHGLRRTAHAGLSGFLFGFGSLGFLGAALALGGWDPNQNIAWETAFPLLVFGALFTSVYTKSHALLVFGTIFLMAYILKITGEYFSEGLGWPTALVIAGLCMIAVGYISLEIHKKYLRA